MTADTKESWIEKGYEMFAFSGLEGLKIEPLAKKVGKSKSSFYHHFSDLEIFLTLLLNRHLEQSQIIAFKEQKVQNIDPELIQIFLEHKIDLLFNRQLRINKNQAQFAETLEKSNQIVGDSFVKVWIKDLNSELTPTQINGLYSLGLENFYLQINSTTLQYDWLSNYFKQLKKITQNFK